MSAWSSVLAREYKFIRAHKVEQFLLFGLPLLLILLIWWIFSSGQSRDLPLAVLDLDQSQLSRQLSRTLDASPALSVAEHPENNAQALQLLQQRKVYAVLVIPEQFAAKLLSGQQATVVLEHNAQFTSHSSAIYRSVQQAINTAATLLNADRQLRTGKAGALALAAPIRLTASALYNEDTDYELFLAATLIPAVLHILAMVIAVSAVGRELRDGSAALWLEAASGSVSTAFAAKLLPYWLICCSWGWLFIWLFAASGRADIQGSGLALVTGMLLMQSAAMAIALLLLGLTKNLRMALSLSGFFSAPAFAYSGQAFPLVAMPAFAQGWASLLPLTHWITLYNQIWLAGAPLAYYSSTLMILLLMVIIPGVAAFYLLRKTAFDPAYWGAK
jgi:ABC-2 type transport system permease protein